MANRHYQWYFRVTRPGGSHLVIGTSTVALVQTTQAGLGGVIMSGLGLIGGGKPFADTTVASWTTVVPFQGRGGRNSVSLCSSVG